MFLNESYRIRRAIFRGTIRLINVNTFCNCRFASLVSRCWMLEVSRMVFRRSANRALGQVFNSPPTACSVPWAAPGWSANPSKFQPGPRTFPNHKHDTQGPLTLSKWLHKVTMSIHKSLISSKRSTLRTHSYLVRLKHIQASDYGVISNPKPP